jgi:hypothetical protein
LQIFVFQLFTTMEQGWKGDGERLVRSGTWRLSGELASVLSHGATMVEGSSDPISATGYDNCQPRDVRCFSWNAASLLVREKNCTCGGLIFASIWMMSGRFQDTIPGFFGALLGAGILGWGERAALVLLPGS